VQDRNVATLQVCPVRAAVALIAVNTVPISQSRAYVVRYSRGIGAIEVTLASQACWFNLVFRRLRAFSARHKNRQPRVLDHGLGHAAENPFAQPGMTVSPHDHELGTGVDRMLA